MNVSSAVDSLQQAFVELVSALESEADETHLYFSGDFETSVSTAKSLKLLGKSDVATNVSL